MRTRFIWLLFFIAVTPLAHAQYGRGAAGLQWTGSSGNSAGTFCWGFSCTPDQTRVTAQERISLNVRGEGNSPFIVFLSVGANQCLSLPGIVNELVLTPPLYVGFTGVLSQFSGIRACPPNHETLQFPFPTGVPSGASFALQAFTIGAGQAPAFTQAIVVTVV